MITRIFSQSNLIESELAEQKILENTCFVGRRFAVRNKKNADD